MAPAAPHRRTWPERVAIAATIAAAVVCFVAAGGLAAAYMVVRNRDVVEISNPAEREPAALTPVATDGAGADVGGWVVVACAADEQPVETTAPETFPPADPTAKNFLITGADNGACVDPSSPYAPAFGDVESGRVGERSDTIMVFRVDPAASRMAVLSFPATSS